MSENGRDFWSDEIIVESVLTPELVLREQAGLLAEKTKGIVRGEVETIEQPVASYALSSPEPANRVKLLPYPQEDEQTTQPVCIKHQSARVSFERCHPSFAAIRRSGFRVEGKASSSSGMLRCPVVVTREMPLRSVGTFRGPRRWGGMIGAVPRQVLPR